MAELKGVIAVIAGNRKGFIILGTEGWFNAKDTELLSKFSKGDKVIITYEVNGKYKNVSTISLDGVKESTPVLVLPVQQVVRVVEQKKEPVPVPVPEVKYETPAPEPVKQEEPKVSSTGFACAICGKELKSNKYKNCYDCNMAAKSTPVVVGEEGTDTVTGPKCIDCGVALKDDKYTKCYPCNQKNPVKKQWKPKSGGYDSPEKTAQIKRGNALNASAAVLCGANCLDGLDPEGIAQVTRLVANLLLDYLNQE